MGYRSDVAIGMKRKYYDELLEKAKNIFDENLKKNALFLLENSSGSGVGVTIHKKTCDNCEYIILSYTWVKWYDTYDAIEWLEENIPEQYAFIRIGEDYDDIEVRYKTGSKDTGIDYNIYDLISVSREINIDAD